MPIVGIIRFRYVDPSGEFVFTALLPGVGVFLDAMCWGAVIGGTINLGTQIAAGNVSNGRDALGVFGIGAAVGAASGAVMGGASSFLLNGGNNLLNGNGFLANWQQSVKSGLLTGAITGGIAGGISGYSEALQQGKNMWWGTKPENWGFQKTKWSINPWSDKDLVLNFESNAMLPGPQCDAMSFAATHGGTPDSWHADLISNKVGETMTYEQYLNLKSINHKTINEIDFYKLKDLHSQGYNKAHLSVTDPNGHRMVVTKIKYVPNKYFKVSVYDPARGVAETIQYLGNTTTTTTTFNAIYNIPNQNFTFQYFTLFK